jgi:hypothetical protein
MSRLADATQRLRSGDSEGASRILQEVLDEPRPGEDAFAASVLRAQALAASGRIEDSNRAYQSSAVAALARAGGRHAAAQVQAQRAAVLHGVPSLRADLVADLEANLSAFQEAHDLDGFLDALGLAARLHLLRAEADLALDRALRLRQSADTYRNPGAATVAALYAGLAYEARGEPALAEQALGAAFHRGDRTVKIQAGAALCRVAARRGLASQVSARAADLRALAGLEPEDIEVLVAVRLPVDGGADLWNVATQVLRQEPALASSYAEIAAAWLRRCPPEDVGGVLGLARSELDRASRPDLGRALVSAAAGRLPDPLPAVEAAYAGAPAWVRGVLATTYADALLKAGRSAEGERLALSAAPALQSLGFDGDALLCWLTGARAIRTTGGDPTAAAAALEQAATLARQHQEPLWQALVALERAQQLRAGGRPHDALAVLPEASWPAVARAAAVIRAGALTDLGRAEEAARSLHEVPELSTPGIELAAAMELARAAGGAGPAGEA